MTLIELAFATAAVLTGVPEQEIGCMAVIVSTAAIALPASDITHYHELSVSPTNWEELKPVGIVGGHLFYK